MVSALLIDAGSSAASAACSIGIEQTAHGRIEAEAVIVGARRKAGDGHAVSLQSVIGWSVEQRD
jgi:hypothetical protein